MTTIYIEPSTGDAPAHDATSLRASSQPRLGLLNTIHSTAYVDHYLGGTLSVRDPNPYPYRYCRIRKVCVRDPNPYPYRYCRIRKVCVCVCAPCAVR